MGDEVECFVVAGADEVVGFAVEGWWDGVEQFCGSGDDPVRTEEAAAAVLDGQGDGVDGEAGAQQEGNGSESEVGLSDEEGIKLGHGWEIGGGTKEKR